jgi:hypothetical protein
VALAYAGRIAHVFALVIRDIEDALHGFILCRAHEHAHGAIAQ